MKVGVAKETAPGERRVALVPEALGRLQSAGLEIVVEADAGAGAAIPDSAYAEAGATIVPTDAFYQQADVVLRVAKPTAEETGRLRSGQAVLGLLAPLIDPALAKDLAAQGVTAISLDAIPRTSSRAQSMDDTQQPEQLVIFFFFFFFFFLCVLVAYRIASRGRPKQCSVSKWC